MSAYRNSREHLFEELRRLDLVLNLAVARQRRDPTLAGFNEFRGLFISEDEIDVVDAHWMALTMWGEARSGGEESMRAVGHVIDNRRRLGRGRYVTETVSEAWQFSAWNAGDPNRSKMIEIDRLAAGTREHDMWLAAKRVAGEILAGRSEDPTGGALFYHTTAVSPRWSAGVEPTRLIGGHLFFASAR